MHHNAGYLYVSCTLYQTVILSHKFYVKFTIRCPRRGELNRLMTNCLRYRRDFAQLFVGDVHTCIIESCKDLFLRDRLYAVFHRYHFDFSGSISLMSNLPV